MAEGKARKWWKLSNIITWMENGIGLVCCWSWHREPRSCSSRAYREHKHAEDPQCRNRSETWLQRILKGYDLPEVSIESEWKINYYRATEWKSGIFVGINFIDAQWLCISWENPHFLVYPTLILYLILMRLYLVYNSWYFVTSW